MATCVAELKDLKNLELLDVSGNMLSGPLPGKVNNFFNYLSFSSRNDKDILETNNFQTLLIFVLS